jgi:hypothetical protein
MNRKYRRQTGPAVQVLKAVFSLFLYIVSTLTTYRLNAPSNEMIAKQPKGTKALGEVAISTTQNCQSRERGDPWPTPSARKALLVQTLSPDHGFPLSRE